MTETNEKAVSRGEYSEGISIETSKVIQGMSLVFAGAMTMLEAIHPKISVEPAELMCLMTGDREGLAQLAEMKKTEAAKKGKEETHESQNADVGSDDDVSASAPDAPVDTAPQKPVKNRGESSDESAEEETTKKATTKKKEASESSVTVDDITKAIVQKIKQDRSNNEKIGQLLKTYGVARVSEIPAERREEFLTEVASI